jgi:hypothetical protein
VTIQHGGVLAGASQPDGPAQSVQVHSTPAEVQGQVFVGRGEYRAHACRLQKSLSQLPDEVCFRIGHRSADLLLIRPEAISDFDPIAASFAYLMEVQLAKTSFDQLPILAQDPG